MSVLKVQKVKMRYSSLWNLISELRAVTCHIGSNLPPDTSEHAHPALTPARQAGTPLTTSEGLKAELTYKRKYGCV